MSGQKGAKADWVYEFEIVYKVGASNIIEDALCLCHVDKEMWAIKTLLARHCKDRWRVKKDLVLTKIVEILINQIHSHAMIVYSRAGSPWVPKFLHEFHTFSHGKHLGIFKEPIQEWQHWFLDWHEGNNNRVCSASNIIVDALSWWHVDKEMWAIKTLLARHCKDRWRVKKDLVLTKIVEILIIQIHSHAMIVYSRAGSPWVPKFLHEFHTFPTGNIWVFLKNLYKNGNIDFLIGWREQ